MNAVGKEIGVTGQTVKRWLLASGTVIRYSRPTYPAALKAEVERLYLGGLSARTVAAKLGLKDFTVKEWLSDAGLIRSMSEAAALSVANGHARSRKSCRLWYDSPKTGERHFAESSLEFLRMQQLDADPDVAAWHRCRLRVRYKSPSGRVRHYVPDLFVLRRDGSAWVEEIKPEALTQDAVNRAKFWACRTLCMLMGWGFAIQTETEVGYARSLAPSALSKEERLRRSNEMRRRRMELENDGEIAARLAHNAAYMRSFRKKQKAKRDLSVGSFSESGTNINTTVLTMWRRD